MSVRRTINQIKRRQRAIREASGLHRAAVLIDKRSEVSQSVKGLQANIRQTQRLLDRSFGYDTVPGIEINYQIVASRLVRFDYGGGDFGLKLELPSETIVTKNLVEITCEADVAGSLNGTYFSLEVQSASYYVWYNVDGAGVDPAIIGSTGIEVEIDEDSVALSVALNTASAITTAVPVLNVDRDAAVLTLDIAGEVEGPSVVDGGVPTGFDFDDIQETDSISDMANRIGVLSLDTVQILTGQAEGRMVEVVSVDSGFELRLDDISTFTGTENDPVIRFILSGEKKSYY